MSKPFYIAIFHHKHGVDAFPVAQRDADAVIEFLREEGSWDEDDDRRHDSYIDFSGPFQNPTKE